MNSKLKKELKKYFREIKKNLNCGFYLKRGFMAQFKESLNEFIENHNDEDLTIDIIYKHFGTPDVIAKSFDDIEDVSKLREKSSKLLMTEIITIIVSLVVVVFLMIIAYLIYSDSLIYVGVDNKF